MNTSSRALLASAVALAIGASADAGAVTLGTDGRGQALIYPYYTVQSSASNPFNTYLSIVNHRHEAKALRVRVREARNSRDVGSFNLYLAPNDVWTAAILPQIDTEAPLLFTADRSCTLPRFTTAAGGANAFTFQNTQYTGALNDGFGTGVDRTREGWVEVIEMASLTGALAAGITSNSSGVPTNCAVVQSPGAGDIAAPTGGLSGTLTLINVLSGMDFTLNADALADLSTRAFYRPPSDPYPDLNALEVDPVSVVTSNGFIYRSTWNRGADAVTAVLMRSEMVGEFILDAGTRSRTEAVFTYPTRQFFGGGASMAPPFYSCVPYSSIGGQAAYVAWYSREGFAGSSGGSLGGVAPPPAQNARCSATSVLEFRNSSPHTQVAPQTGVLGSDNRAVAEVAATVAADNGWFAVVPYYDLPLNSLPNSTRTDIASGTVTSGAHAFRGLPAVAFSLRTFVNGTLACSGGACQGNYGGAFPLKYRRAITP